MTSIVDRFDQLGNATLDGYNGWNSLPNTGTDLEIYDRAVMSPVMGKLIAARQETTLPATTTQRLRASVFVFSGGESSTSHVIIGTSDLRGGVKNSTLMTDWGYGVGLTFATGGSRQMFVLRDSGTAGGYAGGSYTELRRIEVGDSVPNDQKNQNKLLKIDNVDYGHEQILRMRLDVVAAGVRIRGYLNQDDDDLPALEVIDGLDIIKSTDVPIGGNRSGWWFLALGAQPIARGLAIGEFEAEDFEVYTPDAERTDTLTLKDIVDMARARYEGSSSASDFDDGLARQFANDAQNELIADMGDEAWFALTSETLSLTIDGVSGWATMPAKVKRVLSIKDSSSYRDVDWTLVGKAGNGRVVVSIAGYTSATFVVRYAPHVPKMAVDRDHSVVPREFAEALVLGVCMRFADFDKNPRFSEMLATKYVRAVTLLRAEQKRLNRGQKPRFSVPTRPIALGYNDPLEYCDLG